MGVTEGIERNKTVTSNHSQIPEKLKASPQWMPHYAKNPGSGWNLPQNGRSYERALELTKRQGADGVIYIVQKDDPFTFIDLDDC
jgi:hypothetical protein